MFSLKNALTRTNGWNTEHERRTQMRKETKTSNKGKTFTVDSPNRRQTVSEQEGKIFAFRRRRQNSSTSTSTLFSPHGTLGKMTMKPTRAIRLSTRSFARSLARSAARIHSGARSFTRSRAHGKEISVCELNESFSYSFNPLCIARFWKYSVFSAMQNANEVFFSLLMGKMTDT